MDRIAVLLTSFFKQTTEIRFHLDCQLIGNAVTLDYRVVMVDASPETAIGDAFRRIGAMVFPQMTKGIGPSRRELFRHAVKKVHILTHHCLIYLSGWRKK